MNETFEIRPSSGHKRLAIQSLVLGPVALGLALYSGLMNGTFNPSVIPFLVLIALIFLTGDVFFWYMATRTLILDSQGAHYSSLFKKIDLRWSEIRDYGYYDSKTWGKQVYLSTRPLDKSRMEQEVRAAEIHLTPSEAPAVGLRGLSRRGTPGDAINFEAFRMFCRKCKEGPL